MTMSTPSRQVLCGVDEPEADLQVRLYSRYCNVRLILRVVDVTSRSRGQVLCGIYRLVCV